MYTLNTLCLYQSAPRKCSPPKSPSHTSPSLTSNQPHSHLTQRRKNELKYNPTLQYHSLTTPIKTKAHPIPCHPIPPPSAQSQSQSQNPTDSQTHRTQAKKKQTQHPLARWTRTLARIKNLAVVFSVLLFAVCVLFPLLSLRRVDLENTPDRVCFNLRPVPSSSSSAERESV